MPAAIPSRPPESMRPDRPEVMTPVGSGEFFDIEPGVRLECLAGAYKGARGLTTGLVTIAPSASLTYHTHEFAESVTPLKGRGLAAVEGREYALGPLDNVAIPRGPAHLFRNLSDREPLLLHVALAGESPARSPPTISRAARCPRIRSASPARSGLTDSGRPHAPRPARTRRSSTSSTGR